MGGWGSEARAIRMLGVALRVLMSLSILLFIFTYLLSLSAWWLSRSPWSTAKKDILIDYHAAASRQPPQKPNDNGSAALPPYIFANSVSFRVGTIDCYSVRVSVTACRFAAATP